MCGIVCMERELHRNWKCAFAGSNKTPLKVANKWFSTIAVACCCCCCKSFARLFVCVCDSTKRRYCEVHYTGFAQSKISKRIISGFDWVNSLYRLPIQRCNFNFRFDVKQRESWCSVRSTMARLQYSTNARIVRFIVSQRNEQKGF